MQQITVNGSVKLKFIRGDYCDSKFRENNQKIIKDHKDANGDGVPISNEEICRSLDNQRFESNSTKYHDSYSSIAYTSGYMDPFSYDRSNDDIDEF